jgi:hypothetical protein
MSLLGLRKAHVNAMCTWNFAKSSLSGFKDLFSNGDLRYFFHTISHKNVTIRIVPIILITNFKTTIIHPYNPKGKNIHMYKYDEKIFLKQFFSFAFSVYFSHEINAKLDITFSSTTSLYT